MNCGIYQLTFSSGRFYIGSSCIINQRCKKHIRLMRFGRHKNIKLQRSYSKYGAPTVKVLLVCSKEDLIFYEQLCIDGLKPELNISQFADRPSQTEEGKRKQAEALRGRPLSEEHRRKIALAHSGKIHTEEHRRHVGDFHRGKFVSLETKRKQSLAKIGKKHSSETIRRMEESQQRRRKMERENVLSSS